MILINGDGLQDGFPYFACLPVGRPSLFKTKLL